MTYVCADNTCVAILLEQRGRNFYLEWNYDTKLLSLERLPDLYINILLKIVG